MISPLRVTNFHMNFVGTDTRLEHIVTSDGAIVCATNRGEVIVIHEFQFRRVASNLVDIRRIACIGGHLEERTDVNGIQDIANQELKIMILTKSGFIHLWKSSDQSLVRCLISFGRELIVTDICLNRSAVGLVTRNGELFFESITDRKYKRDSDVKRSPIELKVKTSTDFGIPPKPKTVMPDSKKSDTESITSVKSSSRVQQVRSFVRFINRDECHVILAETVTHSNSGRRLLRLH